MKTQAFLPIPSYFAVSRQSSFSHKSVKQLPNQNSFNHHVPKRFTRMCGPLPNSNKEEKDSLIEDSIAEKNPSRTTTTTTVPNLDDSVLTELDQMAEEWIGADISRWEWYERMKARRQRLLRSVINEQSEFDKEVEQLHRALMEFDAVFGTKMLSEDSKITPFAWFTMFFVMGLYVVLGYTIFELAVHLCMDMNALSITSSSPW